MKCSVARSEKACFWKGASRSALAVVLDTCAFPEALKVQDVATLGRFAYRNWDAKRFGTLCERFELAPKKNVKELSRGMGMKLMLAFALSHDPELLVLDEATAGLDPMAREGGAGYPARFHEDRGSRDPAFDAHHERS